MYVIKTYLKNPNIQAQVLEKRYQLVNIINTINIKRIFDIIYMVSKRQGNGPSLGLVFTKT